MRGPAHPEGATDLADISLRTAKQAESSPRGRRTRNDDDALVGAPGTRGGVALSKFSRLTNGCAWNAVSAFANCGRAVAHVRGSYVPPTEVANSFDYLIGTCE